MDLRETHHSTGNRHPWELSRIKALRAIACTFDIFRPGVKILDLGCGDGFIIDELSSESAGSIDAVDINLTSEQVLGFAGKRPRVKFHNDYVSLPAKAYGLVTMFDVLEHVEDDDLFVRDIISRFSQSGADFFCTVPAFQSLFCAHDHFLGHHRRYSRGRLHQVLSRAGLSVIASGYLFASLLPVRAGMVVAEKVFGAGTKEPGIGQWRRGPFVTSAITSLLDLDNWTLLWLNKMGITIPGLTVWALCKAPR